MAKILIIDDEIAQRKIMGDILMTAGHQVLLAESVENAELLNLDFQANVILTDLKMPGRNGLSLVESIGKLPVPPEVVVITAFASVDTAVKAMRLGAYDYLTKPIEKAELLLITERAAEKFALRVDGDRLRQELNSRVSDGLVATSEKMKAILETVGLVAESDAAVLIRGETGTGKEKIARLIHLQGNRSTKPWVAINCAAFPENLLESELFGFEKGAFTGAQSRKMGLIETAQGGTLFLDEIGDMALSTQAKLLRVIQEKEIRRVGGTMVIPINIRIISATHKDLLEGIKNGSFREDLFYRINVIPIHIPPLRLRKDDIPPLVDYFLTKSPRPKSISPDALHLLMEYEWPGNVRELQAVIERVSVLTKNVEVKIQDLPLELQSGIRMTGQAGSGITLGSIPEGGLIFEEWERHLLAQALVRSNGNMSDAARLLGMTYRTFQYRSSKFGLKGD